MSPRRVPFDVFERYVALGPGRSYRELGRQCGVSKRAITRRAAAEDWQARLDKLERAAVARVDEKLIHDMASMDERHLKMVAVLQGRALEALRAMPIHSAAAAARALDAAIGRERAIRGAPDTLRGGAAHAGIDSPTLLDLLNQVNEREAQRQAARLIEMAPSPAPDDRRG